MGGGFTKQTAVVVLSNCALDAMLLLLHLCFYAFVAMLLTLCSGCCALVVAAVITHVMLLLQFSYCVAQSSVAELQAQQYALTLSRRNPQQEKALAHSMHSKVRARAAGVGEWANGYGLVESLVYAGVSSLRMYRAAS